MFNGLISAPKTEISGEWIRLIGARLKHLPKNSDATPLDPEIRRRTLGDLARFSPKEVMSLLGELSEDGVMAAHTLFPQDLFFKAIFSREVILDAMKAATGEEKDGKGDPIGVLSKNASLALYGFFADHPFSHVEEATSRPSSPFEPVEVKGAPFPHTPKPRREQFAHEVEHGSLRTRVQIDNEDLAKRLHSYFTTLLDEIEKTRRQAGEDPGKVTITAIFKTFASDRPDVRSFFQCLSGEVLDKCDWAEFRAGRYRCNPLGLQPRAVYGALGEEPSRDFKQARRGERRNRGLLGSRASPRPSFGATCRSFLSQRKRLFSPQAVSVCSTDRKKVLRQYHLKHWDLISKGKDAKAKMDMLSGNGAFPKELLGR